MSVHRTSPVANAGQYEIQDGWTITGHTLRIQVRDTATNDVQSHTMAWNGKSFDGRLGTYRTQAD